MEQILLEGIDSKASKNIEGSQWNEFFWKEQTVMLLKYFRNSMKRILLECYFRNSMECIY